MGRIKYILIFTLFINGITTALGSNRSEIYNCYITGNMTRWKIVIDRMAEEKRKEPADILELVNYQYGYVGWCIGDKREDEAKIYLEKAESNLDSLAVYEKYNSIVLAYRAAFYGYRIGLNKILAPFIGKKSLDCAKSAIELDGSNFMAWVQLGNSEFYMPSALGGSKQAAIEYYLRAKELMESDTMEVKGNWNYLSLLTVIAQAYSYTEDYNTSKFYIDKILSIEPDFAWVRDELYRQLYEKMKN